MRKKLILCFIICVSIFMLSSCDPSAKYTSIEIVYEDNIISDENEYDFINNLNGLGYSINVDNEKGTFEYKKNSDILYKLKSRYGFILDYAVVEEQDGSNLFIPIFVNAGRLPTKRYKYSLGGIIITKAGDFYKFKKGEIPLTIKDNYIYFFSDISICRRDIESKEDAVVCSLPYDTFPIEYNRENPSDYTSSDYVFNEYHIMVYEDKIEIVGNDWVNNEEINVVLAETEI